MVVIDEGTMVTIGGNQYLQPDYLSPLPTTLDAKKSPLALLAQTCSQIGADSNAATKPNAQSADKHQKKSSSHESAASAKSPSAAPKTPKSNGSPPMANTNHPAQTTPNGHHLEQPRSHQLTFKPYENNVYIKSEDRPSSKSSNVSDESKVHNNNNNNNYQHKSQSPEISVVNHHNQHNNNNSSNTNNNHHQNSTTHSDTVKSSSENGKMSPQDSDRKSISPATSSQRGASPIIRSGLEVLHGHPKDMPLGTYKPNGAYAMNPALAAMCCPPGMEQHMNNPAFRPPFGAGAFSHHHAAMLAAAAAGYQGTPAQHPGPYVSYARVKTPTGGEAIVPVCKDPYCTGCQYSAHNQQMMMGVPCPAGCTQCDHQKFGLAMAMSNLPPGHPYAQLGRPFICNWIAGDNYCGKRYTTSEDLLQHLRTHTASLADPAAAAAALAQSQHQAMLHPLGSMFNPSAAAALHRAYSQPQLSPMSAAAAAAAAARYHPYAKPGSIGAPGSMPTGSPYAAAAAGAFNPAMNPYYSPYAMYGQRLGAAP